MKKMSVLGALGWTVVVAVILSPFYFLSLFWIVLTSGMPKNHGIQHLLVNKVVESNVAPTIIIGTYVMFWGIGVMVLLMGVSLFRQWRKGRAIRSTMNTMARDIALHFPDKKFYKLARRFGIELDPSRVVISKDVLTNCTANAVAEILVRLLYVHYPKIQKKDYRSFFLLADILISSWNTEAVDKFVLLMRKRSAVLGRKLDYAVSVQRIAKEARDCEENLLKRLNELDRRHQEEEKSEVEVELKPLLAFRKLTPAIEESEEESNVA